MGKKSSFVTSALIAGCISMPLEASSEENRDPSTLPNIVLVLIEDVCPDFHCYGEDSVFTPNFDNVASQGTLYLNAFCTSPVCSPSRSALMTGMYQNSIRAHQHRTANKQSLPSGIRPITHYLREKGYFNALGCGYKRKTDLNFTHTNLFDGRDWSERKAGQPFFAQITLGNTHRPFERDIDHPIDESKVTVPPQYPNHRVMRRDWANMLEEIQKADRQLGEICTRLDNEGLTSNTLLILTGDNGRCQVRGKQFLYDGGIHVPLIVRWPGRIAAGIRSDDLISLIDVSAAILDAAGIDPLPSIQGRNFLDSSAPPRKYIFAARDKMDNTHDAMRAIRSKEFKYILNLMPERPWCQYNKYKETSYPGMALMNVLHMKNKLTPEQARFMQATKPKEELYNLQMDPYELYNIAENPKYSEVLSRMRSELQRWRKEINDPPINEEFRNGGVRRDYPTRSLNEWESILLQWEKHLFESAGKPELPE